MSVPGWKQWLRICRTQLQGWQSCARPECVHGQLFVWFRLIFKSCAFLLCWQYNPIRQRCYKFTVPLQFFWMFCLNTIIIRSWFRKKFRMIFSWQNRNTLLFPYRQQTVWSCKDSAWILHSGTSRDKKTGQMPKGWRRRRWINWLQGKRQPAYWESA